MKNLKLVTELSLQLDLLSEGETVLLSAFDIERNRVFFASSANFIYTLHPPPSQGSQWNKSSLNSEPDLVDLEPGDCIVTMDYLIEKESLIIGSLFGCLLLYNMDDKTVETVGKVEGGVKSICSSPDGALLSVTTGLGQLIVMTHDWEVLYENSLDPQISDNDTESEIQSAQISWRGDGKYFSTLVGYYNSNCTQKLMIWERETGTLHSSSQPKLFISGANDWMPSGAKIATACDRTSEGKSPLVVFFERNGLERNSFPIGGPTDITVKSVKWNSNSELLAVCVTTCQYDSIMVWYCSNNHWYLKQEIQYRKEDGVRFSWDPTKPLHLIGWTVSGRIYTYKFAWTTAVTDNSVALVIDGSSVLVTPLTVALMPPPMSLFSFKFRASVRDLSFILKNSKNFLAVCLTDSSLCVVELPETGEWDRFEGNEIGIKNCDLDFDLEKFMHLTWLDTHTLLGVTCYHSTENNNNNSTCFSLREIEIVCSEDSLDGGVQSSGWQAKLIKRTSLERPAIHILPNPATKSSAFVEITGGEVIEYPLNKGSSFEYSFPFACPWIKVSLCNDNGSCRPLLLGLDENGKLYMGKRTICSNCTSFAFYSSYSRNTSVTCQQVTTHVLFTTKQDFLFILDINEILHGYPKEKLDSYSNNSNSYFKRVKESKDHVIVWEKGAKLIGVLHGDEAGVVLQTNRGNLECIYPRKLVLVSILNALSQNRFRDAMSMVRKNRIDFNVIVDYCGLKNFTKLASEFVLQVNNLSHITEFVCSIKKGNVINNLYKPYISMTDREENIENKVSFVLTAVRKALEEKLPECPSRELCILTTLARSEPPLLEESLRRIKIIRELELTGADNAKRQLYPSSEESLKHLLWLTDPESVFNAALGLYDLNLAAIVALNSQKDPKEFLPFLKGLEQLPPSVMKYTIDLRLGRYKNALKNIASAGDSYYGDFMKLLNSNSELFPLGLSLVSTDYDKRKKVLEAWGDQLYTDKFFEDAATTYLSCFAYNKSMKSYRACGDWRGVFTAAGLLNFKKDQIFQLANEICEEFNAMGKPGDAGRIAIEYCKDVERGVGYLVTAREWEEVIRVSYLYEREDLVNQVRDSASECGAGLVGEYEEGVVKVGKYLARYLAVRQRRLILKAKLESEEKLVSYGDDDSGSEISTSFSEMSAYTTRSMRESSSSVTSNKTRGARRQKKGGKIRAGSPGEEMALVEHLKGMALTAGAQRELKSLITALISLGKAENARHLQHCAENFELTQMAAIRLAEDTMGNDIIDESSHTLENYVKILRDLVSPEASSWQIKVLIPPRQVISRVSG